MFSYEHKSERLLPLRLFYRRVLKNAFIAFSILFMCLLIGIIGYHVTAGAGWIDSIHNASMILSGMGPVIQITSVNGKLFSSFYALFSGIAFITNFGVLLAPAVHRLFHRLHLEK
jgi:hypothetical protein